MPAEAWGARDLDDVVPPIDDEVQAPRFELRETRDVEMKGLGLVSVREIYNTRMWMPTISAEDRATEGLQALQDATRYWPRGSATAPPG
jgi:hypothetical protein